MSRIGRWSTRLGLLKGADSRLLILRYRDRKIKTAWTATLYAADAWGPGVMSTSKPQAHDRSLAPYPAMMTSSSPPSIPVACVDKNNTGWLCHRAAEEWNMELYYGSTWSKRNLAWQRAEWTEWNMYKYDKFTGWSCDWQLDGPPPSIGAKISARCTEQKVMVSATSRWSSSCTAETY